MNLPIHAVLPELLAALRRQTSAVLVAPPGAGKTTAIAPALLGEDWCSTKVILLGPRRIAVRAAAERIAELLGERVGETAGYITRLDSKRSARTRILVMTEAIFISAILDDPELAGVSAVLFDEAHERHLDSDLGLALAAESAAVLRPDLRLLVMSATIDGARFSALLGDAPVIESEGRAFPLTVRWLGARPALRLEDAVTSAVHSAWREETGDILVFLPGVGEIRRTAERLAEKLPQALVLPLHGQCEPAAQRAAILRDPGGRRRIVLATAIAESSLTLEGVSVVVDAGLSRRAEYDKAAGVTRLVTRSASQASAAQRAGRAARQGPGVVYRLWEEAAHAARPPFDPPEMLTSDLAPLMLTLARWGASSPETMAWLDAPPSAAMAVARAKLADLGALDTDGRITAHGRAMAALAMEPSLAHMLIYAAQHGAASLAAKLALLLQENTLGGHSDDLAQRLDRWNADRSDRAQASRTLAERWARAVQVAMRMDPAGAAAPNPPPECPPLAILLAEAFPDNLAKRRDSGGENWLTAGGRGLRLDPASPLARAQWLAVGEAQGEAKGARITGAIALDEADLMRWLPHRIERHRVLHWIAGENRVEALVEQRLGAVAVSRGPDTAPDAAAIRVFLAKRVRQAGLSLVPLSRASLALLTRARFAGVASLSESALLADLEGWLMPLLSRRFDRLDENALHQALLNRLAHDERQRLDRLAPPHFTSPAGTVHAIDYDDDGGPSAQVRVQALFGLDRHPEFGHPALPLLLKLTSPGGKPIQTTRDLPGFWRGSWRDVVRDMKGRYPRHRWPDTPWTEEPSLQTRNAFHAARKT